MAAIQHVGSRCCCSISHRLENSRYRRTLGPARHPPASLRPAAASTPLLEPLPSSHRGKRAYPFIDPSFQGLEQVHGEPPVYIVHDLLSAEDCEALIAAATGGALPELQYDQAVLLDTHRLWPLVFVVVAGAAFDVWHSGGPAAAAAGGSAAALLQSAALAAVRWGAAVGALLAAARLAMRQAIGGRVFTGTKWTTGDLFQRGGGSSGSSGSSSGSDAATAAAAVATERFIRATVRLLGTPARHLEPPTVTRYRTGERQRTHFDGRPAGDPHGLAEFMAAGGQRLVQIVAYLRTLEPGQGGETCFQHSSVGGLCVRPRRGDALVFFPAFADGSLDDRMAHDGRPVGAGTEKWIVNTWVCQQPVPSAVRLPSFDEGAACWSGTRGAGWERGQR